MENRIQVGSGNNVSGVLNYRTSQQSRKLILQFW